MRETCTKVWCELIKLRDDDGEPGLALYHNPFGDDTDPSPMYNQVRWIGYYEPTSGESTSKAELAKIQKRDLASMMAYLDEQNEDRLAQMDEKLNNPRRSRLYQFWLDAKAAKDAGRRQRSYKKNWKNIGQKYGVSLAEMQELEDEGFERDDEEEREREAERKRQEKNAMPPPRGQPPSKKRKANSGSGAAAAGEKKKKKNTGKGAAPKVPRAPSNHDPSPLFMSGGRGGAGGEGHQFGGFDGGHRAGVLNGQDTDFDDIFADQMDTRPPDETGSSPTPSSASREQSVGPGSVRGVQRGTNGAGGVAADDYVHPTTEIASEATNGNVSFEEQIKQAVAASRASHEEEIRSRSPSRGLREFGSKFGMTHGVGQRLAAARGDEPNGRSTGQKDYNAGMGEEEAVLVATRASMMPDEPRDPFNFDIDRNISIPSAAETARKARGSVSQEQRGTTTAGPFMHGEEDNSPGEVDDGNHDAAGADGAQGGGSGAKAGEDGAEEEGGGKDDGDEGDGEGEVKDGEDEGLEREED